MKLLPREADKLALHNAGFLAQKRLARGLRLNYTEAVALIAAQVSHVSHLPSLPSQGLSVSGRAAAAPPPSHLCSLALCLSKRCACPPAVNAELAQLISAGVLFLFGSDIPRFS